MYQSFNYGNYTPTLADLDKANIPIFNDWWDTYIPEYKPILIRKIMHAYYFNQIGAETPERFIHYINTQLEQIMPYYNQLYKSELINVNPLLNHYMETNGRKIENLISKANTTDDKVAKAIRDFTGMTDKSGTGVGSTVVSGTANKLTHENTNYSKSGTDDETDKSTASGTENEDTVNSGNVTETLDRSESVNKTEKEDATTTTDIQETPGQVTTKAMQWGQTETGKESLTGKDTSSGGGSKNWDEKLVDDATTKTVTDLDETTSTSGEKDYADTPQKQLSVTSQQGTSKLRADYLTNVTWTSDSQKHNADTDQDVTFHDDQTKTHNEQTTDTNTTDKTSTTDTTKSKGGTDTETTTLSGKNDTHKTETKTSDSTANTDTQINATNTTENHSTVNRDLTTADSSDTTRDRDWTEKGQSSTDGTAQTTQASTTKNNSSSTGHESSRESATNSALSSNVNSRNETSTTDTGSTNITSGFMNVSASALLEAFRKTFLNIDQMIIEELRENFMLVY